jgi:hypothetical protein
MFFAAVALAAAFSSWAADPCAPLPPATPPIIQVSPSQAAQLRGIIAGAASGTTILLEDGVYDLSCGDSGCRLQFNTPGLTLRSLSGDRDAVVLDGAYATNELISIYASNVTVADFTVTRAYDHPIHISGPGTPISGILLHNLKVVDPGQQAVKVNPVGDGVVDDSTMRCSHIELTDAGRPHIRDSCYTGGIDVHRATNWWVHQNYIEGFWCENGLSEHGIHFWRASEDTLVENNVILDCVRGIGFGLGSSAADGHVGGTIRNNFIAAVDPALDASDSGFDTGIGLESAAGAVVDHNTVVSTFTPRSSSIEWRWPLTTATLANNLTSHNLKPRNGGQASLQSNIENADLGWFIDPGSGDLHLTAADLAPVDGGAPLPPGRCDHDFDGEPRDDQPDVGADEWGGIFADGFESGDVLAWGGDPVF